jgi:serine/threonine protein kinase
MARDDFEIVDQKPIGCGQFGTVFKARQRSNGRMAALKLILRRGANGGDTIAAERRGATLQQGFASLHGMVPEVFEFGPDDEDFYIAMELVEGPSLEERLRGGALPYDEAVSHAVWLCDFLDEAHGFSPVVEGRPYRLLHNDLKPAHLKIPEQAERKVLDFGIAKALEESRELATDVGRTIAYAAPERLLSERVNVHADFWSLGVMLYEMASGHRPYPDLEGPRHRRQLYSAITSNAPRAALPRDCPPHLQGIIYRLLAFQPEHRYQSAAEIQADLERFARGETPDAAAYFETPATLPVTRSTASSPETDIRPVTMTEPPPLTASASVPGLAAAVAASAPAPTAAGPTTMTAPASATMPAAAIPVVPATDPVPVAVSQAANMPAPGPNGATAAAAARARTLTTRFVAALATLMFLSITTTELVAWMAAEHFRNTIPSMDERSVISSREAYEGIAHWSLFDLGLRTRVDRPLVEALRAIGDRVIADYRREAPTMGPEEWRQAQAAFSWARSLSSGDASLRSKELIAEGHVRRLAAQKAKQPSVATSNAQAAVTRFRDAAAADPSSYDPYLGMAVTQAYALGDVDGALAALDEATKRGYTQTRRETALIGDACMRRAATTRKRAGMLTGDERRNSLVSARGDYERCVSSFAQIVTFGKSVENLNACKAQIRRIDQQLLLDVVEGVLGH